MKDANLLNPSYLASPACDGTPVTPFNTSDEKSVQLNHGYRIGNTEAARSAEVGGVATPTQRKEISDKLMTAARHFHICCDSSTTQVHISRAPACAL